LKQPHRFKGGTPRIFKRAFPVQNSPSMAKGLVRYQKCGVFHFFTFSCSRRQPLLNNENANGVFARELGAVRRRYRLVVVEYVLMPEHVHLLVGEPLRASLSTVSQVFEVADIAETEAARGNPVLAAAVL
jgi:hypothetical protein